MKKNNQGKYRFNEHDENQVLAMRNKLRRKKRKRRRRFVVVVLMIILIIAFFVSDLSKVKTINITGCQKLDKQYVLDSLSVHEHESYYFTVDTSQLKKETEKLIFVKKAEVSKSFFGDIEIKIQECDPATYCYIDNRLYVADLDGVIQEDLEQKYLSYVQRMPQAMNFDMEHLKSFVKAYIKIPSDVQNQISTIVFEPDEKDLNKCRLEMDDGKIFYVRIDNMADQLTSSNYYLVMNQYPDYKYYDFLGKNVYVYN